MRKLKSKPAEFPKTPNLHPKDQISYRCPVCREMVNGYDRAAVSLHHQHVLRPYFFRATIPDFTNGH